jgi:hypothetical protein
MEKDAQLNEELNETSYLSSIDNDNFEESNQIDDQPIKEELNKNKRVPLEKKTMDKKKLFLVLGIVCILLIASISSVVFVFYQGGDGDNNEGSKKQPDTPIELDTDNDGHADDVDAFPNNPHEWIDTDKDGIGDNADSDDDNDGVSDAIEDALGTDSKDNQIKPSKDDLDDVKDIPKNLTNYEYEEKEGIIIYDSISKNYKTNEAKNTGYFISMENIGRTSELYYNVTKLLVPENCSTIKSGKFTILTDVNGSYLVKSTPSNVTDATNKILDQISQFDFKNIETDFVSVGISYNHYTYGIGVNENKEFIYVTLDDKPTMFTNVHVSGTVVPFDFFLNTGIINIDIMKNLDLFKNIYNINFESDLPSFLIVNEMTYKSQTIKGDSYDVITPNEVANLAENLSSDGISELTKIARNITEQLIILGDYDNDINDSTLWMILLPTELDPQSLTGIVEIDAAESDLSLLMKRLNIDFSHNMEIPHKIKIAVSHENNPKMASNYVQNEVHDTWNEIKGKMETMIESVQIDNFALVIDIENFIDGLAESIEISEENLKYIKALTSFRNPGIALMVDQNFTNAFDGDFDLIWNFSGIAILPNFNGYETRAMESDSLLYHLRIKGVLYNLWNLMDLEHNVLREMPLIIADSYSILKESESTTLSDLHNNKDEVIGDSYDFLDFRIENNQIKSYHVPVFTLEWGFSDTALGNHIELEGFYVSIENIIQKGVDISQGLLNCSELNSEFSKHSKSILESPILLKLLEKASESPIQILKGFFLVINYNELEPELRTNLLDFYPANPLKNGDMKIHLEIEGIAIGTSLKNIASSQSKKLPLDAGLYVLFESTGTNYPTYLPYYEVPIIFLTTEKAQTYLGKCVKINGIYIQTSKIRDNVVDSISNYFSFDKAKIFEKLRQISSLTKFTDNIIKVYDGFIYAYDIQEIPEDQRPPNLKITKLTAEESVWVTSDPNDDYKTTLPDNMVINNGEWNFCYPKIEATVYNSGGKSDLANIQFLLTNPSQREENINGTSFSVSPGKTSPGFATKIINEPEVGNYKVKAYLFKNGTFKEYIENKTTTFNVKHLAGNISVNNMNMRSWETKELKVNVSNTGSYATTYTIISILIPDSFFGIYINDGNILSLNLIKFKTTNIISSGNTETLEFEISTRWSGGTIHFFLFNGTKSSLIEIIEGVLEDVINKLTDLIQPEKNLIFEGIDSINDWIMLSHDLSIISFSCAEEITGANVQKVDDYYYGDGFDAAQVDINVTIHHNYDINYLIDWLWNDRVINVTIFKNNIEIKRISDKWNDLIDFGGKKRFPVYIDHMMGWGWYKFNLSLSVYNSGSGWSVIDTFEIIKEIRINISDAEIIDISPNVMPIDTNNNEFKITIRNTGNITQKFHLKIIDQNTLLNRWITLGKKEYTTQNSYSPNSEAVITFYLDSRSDSINGSFKVSLEPYKSIIDLNDLDTKYHWINVGPRLSNFYIANDTSALENDTRHLTHRENYVFCDIKDQNSINIIEILFDFDNELNNNYSGKLTMTWINGISGISYRSVNPIPPQMNKGSVIVSINASDKAKYKGYTNNSYYFYIWYDSSETSNNATLVNLNDSWEESIGHEDDQYDWFKIHVNRNVTFYINLTFLLIPNFDLYLYNSSLIEVDKSTSLISMHEKIEFPVYEDEYYYIRINKSGIVSGNYNITFESGNLPSDSGDTFAKARLMKNGWQRDESLTKIIDTIDFYKIYLKSGQTLYVNLSVPLLCDFDLYLYNSTFIEKDSSENDQLGGGADEAVSDTAIEDGYYYIKVSLYITSPGGTYTITFDVDG